MGSFNRKSGFWKPENLNKPITKGDVILTAEADSLSTDTKELLEDNCLVGCHLSRSNYMSVHARIDSTGYVRFLWESSEEDDENTHMQRSLK